MTPLNKAWVAVCLGTSLTLIAAVLLVTNPVPEDALRNASGGTVLGLLAVAVFAWRPRLAPWLTLIVIELTIHTSSAVGWLLLLATSCLSAGVGSVLRNRNVNGEPTKIEQSK